MPTPQEPRRLDFDLEPYAGRYIALVEGRIVAVGDTAEAAFHRARLTHQQRPATILYIAGDVAGAGDVNKPGTA